MAEIKQLFQIVSLPGIKRDGTSLDSDSFVDGQWCRFQRGRPKKMGGTQLITDQLTGPVRKLLVWSRQSMNAIVSMSPTKVEQVLVDNNGSGSSIIDRTPAGFTPPTNCIWSYAVVYDDASGSDKSLLLAHASNSMANIDDTTAYEVYYGGIDESAALVASGITVSGGVLCISPYTVYYGSDGEVIWSNQNEPRNVTTGDAGADRVTGAKIVMGLPLRSGAGPAALLWALDSLLRMDYIGGAAIFKFTTISSQTSILAQNSVIEYDGDYFWVGIDRFLMFSGGSVQELPNAMNLNWFFDNLNYDQRQKVWATKIPRYGEIWWHFPYGDATECTHAIIFNVREKVWYDTRSARSAGYYSQVFRYPVMASPDATDTLQLTLTVTSGAFVAGDTLQGVTSGAQAQIISISGTSYTVRMTSGPLELIATEGATNITGSGTATIAGIVQLYGIHLHEKGHNAVALSSESAIESYFETADFGLPTGGARQNDITGLNRWTRIIRVEPDFVLDGGMTMVVKGQEFAQGAEVTSEAYDFDATTTKIDLRQQRRELRLKFVSNEINGHYEMGRVILHTEPGDLRS